VAALIASHRKSRGESLNASNHVALVGREASG
jgi:hypothetical protein